MENTSFETIEKIISELNQLKEYKSKYENQLEAMQMMSDKLYELEMAIYKTRTPEENRQKHVDDVCFDCRYGKTPEKCGRSLPENVWMPTPSNKAWMPGRTICQDFRWD